MDNRMEHYGKTLAVLVFGIEAFLTIVFYIGWYSFPSQEVFILLGEIILSIIVFIIMTKKRTHGRVFCCTFALITAILAYQMSIATESPLMFQIVCLLQWPVVAFFQSRLASGVTALVEESGLLFLFISSGEQLMSIYQYITCTGAIIICMWFVLLLVGTLKDKEDKNLQQERASQDMLVVVEAMYDEAKDSTSTNMDSILRMAKNLRAPARTILMSGESLKNDEIDEKQKRELLKRIEGNSRYLLGLSEALMDYTSLEKGKMVLREEELDLRKVLEKLLSTYIPMAKEKKLKLEIRLPEKGNTFFVGDEDRIYTVLSALLDNAIRYTNSGSVCLTMYQTGARVGNEEITCEISDTGSGIRSVDIDNVFEAFYQHEEKGPRSHGGAGLGLYRAKKIVSLMGGNLILSSEYGTGTVAKTNFFVPVSRNADETLSLHDAAQKCIEQIEEKMKAEKEMAKRAQKAVKTAVEEEVSDTASVEDSSVADAPLPDVPGIDWSQTYLYLPTKDVIIQTAIQLYKKGAETVREVSDLFYEYKTSDTDRSREDYRIKVHALKGTSKTIGAMELSDKAKALEFAARDNDREYILNQTENFIADYEEFLRNLELVPGVVSKEEEKLKPFDPDVVQSGIKTIENALQEFDMETADLAVAQLKEYSYPSEMAAVISEVEKHVLNLDVAAIRKEEEKLQIWLKK